MLYYIDKNGKPRRAVQFNHFLNNGTKQAKERYKLGNYFKTWEDAEKYKIQMVEKIK